MESWEEMIRKKGCWKAFIHMPTNKAIYFNLLANLARDLGIFLSFYSIIPHPRKYSKRGSKIKKEKKNLDTQLFLLA